MPTLKDRKPAAAGSRSFFPMKIFLTLLTVIIALTTWWGTRMIVSIVPENGRAPITFTVKPGDAWNIAFTHSVEKTPWEEFFRVNGIDDMTMTHTRFESFGWGFPYSSGDGRLSHTDDGKFILEMNRPYKMVNMRISEQAMQHIIHENDDYDLVAMYGQGAALKIKVQYRYQFWLEHYFNFI